MSEQSLTAERKLLCKAVQAKLQGFASTTENVHIFSSISRTESGTHSGRVAYSWEPLHCESLGFFSVTILCLISTMSFTVDF